MKDRLVEAALMLTVIFALTLSGCKDEKIEGEFSVLTYNVAGLPEGISGSHPALYTTSISKLINEFDVVHVQEDFCYHDSLLLHNTHPHRTQNSIGCDLGNDGLNTFSNFEVKGLQRIKWNHCTQADCLTDKGFSYSQMEVAPGVVIDFYNIHANAQSEPEAKAARRENIKQILSYISQHSQGTAAIVMGDFNSRYTRDGDTIHAFLDFGFKDVWVELVRGGDAPQLGAESLGNCDDFPKEKPDCEEVDKIFYRSSESIKLTPVEFRLDDPRFYYQNNDTLPLSDHSPVYAKFRYEGEK